MDLHCLAIPTDSTTLWWQYCGSTLLDLVAMMQNFITPESNEITISLCPCTQKHLISVFLDSDHLKFTNGPYPVHVQCCVNLVGSLYQSAHHFTLRAFPLFNRNVYSWPTAVPIWASWTLICCQWFLITMIHQSSHASHHNLKFLLFNVGTVKA